MKLHQFYRVYEDGASDPKWMRMDFDGNPALYVLGVLGAWFCALNAQSERNREYTYVSEADVRGTRFPTRTIFNSDEL